MTLCVYICIYTSNKCHDLHPNRSRDTPQEPSSFNGSSRLVLILSSCCSGSSTGPSTKTKSATSEAFESKRSNLWEALNHLEKLGFFLQNHFKSNEKSSETGRNGSGKALNVVPGSFCSKVQAV